MSDLIKIYESTETQFNNNGLKSLRPLSAVIRKEDNGDYYLTIQDTAANKEYYAQDNIIRLDTPWGVQGFRCGNCRITGNRVKVKAWHLYYDSSRYIIRDAAVQSRTCNYALQHFNESCDSTTPFTVESDITAIASYRCVRKSFEQCIKDIVERWNGHLVRDNWDIKIKSSISVDRGIVLSTGKNMVGFDVKEDWSEVVTKLLAEGKDGITLDNYLVADVQYNTPYTKTIKFDQDIDEQDYVSEAAYKDAVKADLLNQATAYLNINKYPKVNYDVEATNNLQDVADIGDKIVVKAKEYGITLDTNVIAVEYDCLCDRYIKIEFGNFRRTIKNLVTQVNDKAEQDIANAKKDTENKFKNELIKATNDMWEAMKSSYVIYDKGQILILDKLPKEQAVNVIRINSGGIGFSNNGINGTFTSAWTIDNTLNMENINVLNLTADLIQGGTLTLGGKDNCNGSIAVYDTTGNVIAKIDKNGMQFVTGSSFTSIDSKFDEQDTAINQAKADAIADTDNKLRDYSTTTQVGAAITASANGVLSTVEKKTTEVKNYADTKANAAKEEAIEDTTEKLKSYSNTEEMNSAISQTAENITSTVNKKIAETKEYADTQATSAMNGAIADTTEKLESYSTTTEMNTAIEQTAESITSTVNKKTTELKKYTDTKASDALTAAKKDAASKANTAKSDAIADTTEKLKEYSKTEEMNSAIAQKADSITSTVDKKIKETKTYADTQASTAKEEAIADTATKLENYSTTTEMHTAIDQQADSITSTVEKKITETKTYADTKASSALSAAKSDATTKANAAKSGAIADTVAKLKEYSKTEEMNSAIAQTAESITSTVTKATIELKTYADTKSSNALSAAKEDATTKANAAKADAIADTAEKLADYSKTEDMNSAIEQKADSIVSTVNKKVTETRDYVDLQANAAKNAAISNTDEKLKSYSTTTQMNSAIDQQADSITSTVNKQIQETKDYADTQSTNAKNAAIADTVNKLKSYSTTSSMNSAIVQESNRIKSSVDTKITETKTYADDKVENLELGGVNLLVQKTITKGKYLLSTGLEKADAGWFYSDYIYVFGMKNIIQSGYTYLGMAPSTCFYDKDKKFIKGINGNGTYATRCVTVPTNAYYMRVSGQLGVLNQLKFEQGTKSTAYSKAPQDIQQDIVNAKAGAIADTQEKLKSYSTTLEMNSAIDQKADSITSTVNSKATELKEYAEDKANDALTAAKSDATSKANSAKAGAIADTTTRLKSYAKTTEMNTAIAQKADSITSTVDKKITETKTYAETKANAALTAAIADTEEKLESYSTTTEMNSAIDQKADSITSTVNVKTAEAKSYADTKATAAKDAAIANTTEKLKSYSTTKDMNTAIQQKADSITSTVNVQIKTTKDYVDETAEDTLNAAKSDATTKANAAKSGAIADTTNKLKSYTKTEDMNSAIEQKADSILSTVDTKVTETKEYADGKATSALNAAKQDATSKANSAKAGAIADTVNRLKSYSTTTAMNSAIDQRANSITSTVNEQIKTTREYADEKVDDLELGGVNLLVQKNVTKNKYLSKTGVAVAEPAWFYTDYIYVHDMKNIVQSGYYNLGNSPSICFYNEDKEFISGINGNNQSATRCVEVPSTAYYARVSGGLSRLPYIKIEQGTKPTAYTKSPQDVDSAIVQAKSDAIADTTNKLKSYATTTAMNTAIQQKADSILSTVSVKTTEAKTYADTKASAAKDAAIANTTEKLKSYTTTKDMNTAIDQKADSILSTVDTKVTETKEYAEDKSSDALSAAKTDATNKANSAKSGAIADTVNRLKSYSTTTQMNSAIDQKANSITSTVNEQIKTTREYADNKVNALELGGVNLLVQKTVTKGKYLKSTGTEQADAGWFYSDYIYVHGIKNVVQSGYNYLGSAPSTCFYDEDKKFISGINGNAVEATRCVTVPSTAYYMRVSGQLYLLGKIKFEQGTKPTVYSKAPQDLDSDIVKAKTDAIADTANRLKNYSTTTQMNTAIEQKADSILSTVDTKTTETKTYADSKATAALNAAKEDATTKANNALAAAKTDATNKANSAKSGAIADTAEKLKSYSKTTEMNTAIDQKADSITSTVEKKITETKEYADDKATAALTAAKADTDEKLKSYSTTTEVNSAIDQKADSITSTVTQKITETKSYADGKATAALNAAKSDATTKANAAKSGAIADTTEKLKSYSTTTEMNSAIQQKADSITSTVNAKTAEAKTYADTKVNALELGGINLLVQKTITKGKYLKNTGTEQADAEWFYSDYIYVHGMKNVVQSGYKYLGMAPSTCFYDEDKKFLSGINGNATEATRCVTVPPNAYYMRVSGQLYLLGEIKFEQGTKPTAYSKAPQDIDSSIVQAKNDAISDTTNRLKSYSTTTQMNSAIQQKADSIISTVNSKTTETKTYADTKATAALNAAKADATERLKDYSTTTDMNSAIDQKADSITSTVTQKITETKSYADTKATAALNAAKTDATNKANSAKAGAIADTNEKLKSYSTTTQMNSAIAQKADSITSTVNAKITGIEIGGQNYIENSDFTTGKVVWTVDKGTASVVSDTTHSKALSVTVNGNLNRVYWSIPYELIKDRSFTVSYYCRCSAGTHKVTPNFSLASFAPEQSVSTTWQRYTTTVKLKDNHATFGFVLEPNIVYYFAKIKVERGTKATDYSISPKDILNKFSSYSTTTQMNSAIQQKADSITSTVNQKTTEAKTYAEGKATDALNAAKSDATTKANNALNAAKTDATTKANTALATAKSDATSKADAAKSAAIADAVNRLKAYSTTAQMNSAIQQKADSIISTVSGTYTTKADFSNLQIGGTNLIKGTSSEWFKVMEKPSGTNYCKSYKLITLSDPKLNDLYTISCDVKYEGFRAGSILSQGAVDNSWGKANIFSGVVPSHKIQNGEFHYTKLCKVTDATCHYYDFGFRCDGSDGNGVVYIRNFKVERGSKATDWTPAPEDVATDATNKANAALDSAKADATTKANAAKSGAIADTINRLKSYSTTTAMNSAIDQRANSITSTVNEKITETREYADTQATSALNTAKGDATTKANNALNAAKADATTKATAAKNAAIADTVNRLKSYSTTTSMNSAIDQKANSILSTVNQKTEEVKEYADDKANAAKSGAIADTVNRLKSYSTTTAMNSAIDQKANSITSTVNTKITESKTYTDNKVNGLELGGVNLLIQKNANKGAWLGSDGTVHGDGGWFYTDYIYVHGMKNLVQSGYTNLGVSPSVCFYNSSKGFISGINGNGQSKTRLVTVPSTAYYARVSGTIGNIGTIKIEQGTKATAYSKAPQDVDNDVAQAKTYADSKATSALNSAKSDATTKANAAKSAAIADTVNRLKSYSTTTEMNSAIQQKADSITSIVNKSVTDMKNYTDQSLTDRPTRTDMASAIKQKADSISSTVTEVTGGLASRITAAEQKITATAIVNSVNSAVSGGKAIETTSTKLSKDEFRVKNGRIVIENKSGKEVVKMNTAGDIDIQGNIYAEEFNSNGTVLSGTNLVRKGVEIWQHDKKMGYYGGTTIKNSSGTVTKQGLDIKLYPDADHFGIGDLSMDGSNNEVLLPAMEYLPSQHKFDFYSNNVTSKNIYRKNYSGQMQYNSRYFDSWGIYKATADNGTISLNMYAPIKGGAATPNIDGGNSSAWLFNNLPRPSSTIVFLGQVFPTGTIVRLKYYDRGDQGVIGIHYQAWTPIQSTYLIFSLVTQCII